MQNEIIEVIATAAPAVNLNALLGKKEEVVIDTMPFYLAQYDEALADNAERLVEAGEFNAGWRRVFMNSLAAQGKVRDVSAEVKGYTHEEKLAAEFIIANGLNK